MSFSYDPNLTTALDQVRFEISDTEDSPSNPALVQNEEILALLTRYSQNVFLTAARLCDRLAGTFARQGTLKMGDLMTSGMDQARFFKDLGRKLRLGSGAGPKRTDASEDAGRYGDLPAGAAHSGTSEDRPWISIDR